MAGAHESEVVIVGGGPAGMVCGLLLARAGIAVTVLEKNSDFAREFRGEILQPRFFRAIEQVGLRNTILQIPHQKFEDFRVFVKGRLKAQFPMQKIDSRYPYVTWMTQPDLLQGLLDQAQTYPQFRMEFEATVTNVASDDRKCLVDYKKGDQDHQINCQVTVGCDGRFSRLRKILGAELSKESHRFDVMWFEMKRPETYTHGADFFFSPSFNCLVLPKHPNKIQCGILISPGTLGAHVKTGPAKLARQLKQVHPMFESFADQLVDFKSFTVLAAKLERVAEWAGERTVLIGDAAHTCSPVGAIGVTIAVESALVAADQLISCHRRQDYSYQALKQIQLCRQGEVEAIHRFQETGWQGLQVGRQLGPLFGMLVAVGVESGLVPAALAQIISRRKPLPLEHFSG